MGPGLQRSGIRWTGSNISPGLRLDLNLGPQTSLHVAGRYTKIDGDINAQGLIGLAADGRTANRFQYHEISTWHEYQSDTFVATTARTGRLEHRIVTGIEAGLIRRQHDRRRGGVDAGHLQSAAFQPAEPVARPTRYDVNRLGVYAVDQVRFGERVIVVPALRWSRLEIENRVATTGEQRSSENVVSPSVGLVVMPRNWLSLYTTFAQGFEPPTPGQYLEDGQALAPAEHNSIEGGVKADVLEQRISLTGAVYRIRRTNVPEAEPAGSTGKSAKGKVVARARGGRQPGAWARAAWRLFVYDNRGDPGHERLCRTRSPNAPRHKAELWMRYRVPHGFFQKLMVAGGVVYVAERFTARDNAVVVPAFTRLDGSAWYELAGPRLVLGLVAQNLTDRRYVTSGNGGNSSSARLNASRSS